jgi:hypothetical protein
MSWHEKEDIKSTEQMFSEMKVVIECLHRIPSMSSKLPNYINNRIQSIMEFTSKNGWDEKKESK